MQCTAGALAWSGERVPGSTPTHKKRGPGSFSASAKRTGSRLELNRVKELVYFLAEFVPHAQDRVGMDRAGLLGDTLSLRATREQPGGAGVIDGKGAGREAKEIVVRLV